MAQYLHPLYCLVKYRTGNQKSKLSLSQKQSIRFELPGEEGGVRGGREVQEGGDICIPITDSH